MAEVDIESIIRNTIKSEEDYLTKITQTKDYF